MRNAAEHDDAGCHNSAPARGRGHRALALAVACACLIAAFPVGRTDAAALQQYRSAGHVLGFDRGGYYVANGTYAMRV